MLDCSTVWSGIISFYMEAELTTVPSNFTGHKGFNTPRGVKVLTGWIHTWWCNQAQPLPFCWEVVSCFCHTGWMVQVGMISMLHLCVFMFQVKAWVCFGDAACRHHNTVTFRLSYLQWSTPANLRCLLLISCDMDLQAGNYRKANMT